MVCEARCRAFAGLRADPFICFNCLACQWQLAVAAPSRSPTPVALKVVLKTTVLEGGVNCLAHERDVLGQLPPHPAIVALHGSSQDEDSVCLVFELLAGGDLGAHLR